MSMSRKDFITLANHIKMFNLFSNGTTQPKFDSRHLSELADFCARQNPNFKRQLWLDYIAGKVGPKGGKQS